MRNELTQLSEQLLELSRKKLDAAERKALKAVGTFCEAELKARTPVQAGVAEGWLAENELAGSVKAFTHVAGDDETLDGGVSNVTIGPRGKRRRLVAEWVEYGHDGPRRDGKRTPPHPFIRPTQDAVESEAESIYASTLTEEIEKALK